MTFGEKLKKLMKEKRLTQEDVAKITGRTRQSVSEWVNDKTLPRINIVQKIADYFNVSINYLLDENVEDINNVSNLRNSEMKEYLNQLELSNSNLNTVLFSEGDNEIIIDDYNIIAKKYNELLNDELNNNNNGEYIIDIPIYEIENQQLIKTDYSVPIDFYPVLLLRLVKNSESPFFNRYDFESEKKDILLKANMDLFLFDEKKDFLEDASETRYKVKKGDYLLIDWYDYETDPDFLEDMEYENLDGWYLSLINKVATFSHLNDVYDSNSHNQKQHHNKNRTIVSYKKYGEVLAVKRNEIRLLGGPSIYKLCIANEYDEIYPSIFPKELIEKHRRKK